MSKKTKIESEVVEAVQALDGPGFTEIVRWVNRSEEQVEAALDQLQLDREIQYHGRHAGYFSAA